MEYLDKTGLDALWAKLKRTFITVSTYVSHASEADNRFKSLETRVTMLESKVKNLEDNSSSGGTSGGGSDSGSTTPSGIQEVGSISGNNEITVTGVDGEYTLVYIDSNGNELSNYSDIEYKEITK